MPFTWLKRLTKPQSEPLPPTPPIKTTRADAPPVRPAPTAAAPTPPRVEPEPTRTATATVAPPPPAEPARPRVVEITSDKIAQRAYQIWVDRGRPAGSHDQDWRDAEAALRDEFQTAAAEALPHRSR